MNAEQPLKSELSLDQGAMPVQPELSTVTHDVPIVVEHALIRVLAMLQQHNLASSEDCSQVAAAVRKKWLSGKGADPIDCLARFS